MRDILKDLFNIFKETHIQHFICFIKYNDLRVEDIYLPFSVKVLESSRCCHNDLHTLVDDRYLTSIPYTAINCQGSDTGKTSQVVEFIRHLRSQLSCWGNNQCSLYLAFCDLIHHRKTKCCGLTCTCMGLTHHITPT